MEADPLEVGGQKRVGIVNDVIDGSSEVYLVGGHVEDIRSAVASVWTLRGEAGHSNIKLTLIGAKDVLKEALDDLVIGSWFSEMVKYGEGAVFVTDQKQSRLVIGDQSAYTVIDTPGGDVYLSTDDGDSVQELKAKYDEIVDSESTFKIRVPTISSIRSSLDDVFDDGVIETFDEVFTHLSKEERQIKNTTIFLLIAAYEGLLQYDISRFGNDVGVASTATFSRDKGQLEDENLIETKKVPRDIGRPRLRIHLHDSVKDEVEEPSDLLRLLD